MFLVNYFVVVCFLFDKDNNKGCTNYTFPAILSRFFDRKAAKGGKGVKGGKGRKGEKGL